jgi:hypothetical protein
MYIINLIKNNLSLIVNSFLFALCAALRGDVCGGVACDPRAIAVLGGPARYCTVPCRGNRRRVI